MTRVLLSAEQASQLVTTSQPVEMCDPSGNVVGTFFPRPSSDLYRNILVPFTEEELDQAEAEPGGRTLQEILADLEKR